MACVSTRGCSSRRCSSSRWDSSRRSSSSSAALQQQASAAADFGSSPAAAAKTLGCSSTAAEETAVSERSSRQQRDARSRSCRAHELQLTSSATSSPSEPQQNRHAAVAATRAQPVQPQPPQPVRTGRGSARPLAVPAARGPAARVPEPRPFGDLACLLCLRERAELHISCISNRSSTRVCNVSIECGVLPRVRRGRVAPPLAPARSDGQRMQYWVWMCHCEGSRHTREEWRGGGA